MSPAGTTLFMTLLAVWSVVLSRLSGQGDIVVGTPLANRKHSETEGLIAFSSIRWLCGLLPASARRSAISLPKFANGRLPLTPIRICLLNRLWKPCNPLAASVTALFSR
ncbi:hypothetical protein GMW71_13775 [Pectobacterium brasiliense]|nr:hypothetical protein GMW71_13775 [Pectobacterium brasiliense]